jgi:hypothetical protein
MPYEDKMSCKVGDRKIIHGEFISFRDWCAVCNDGELEENYDQLFGGIAGAGMGDVVNNELLF